MLLVRVEDRTGISHLCPARSADGLTGWVIDPECEHAAGSSTRRPSASASRTPASPACGDEHLIVYTGYSDGGPLVCLASTRDFRTYERRGVLMPPEDKDAALFPRQFDGRWALIHRPVATTPRHTADIWLSWSPDLRHWGDHAVLLAARDGSLVGRAQGRPLRAAAAHDRRVAAPLPRRRASPPPARSTGSGSRCSTPSTRSRVLARSSEWIFGPDAPYERTGDVDQVVFSCGWLLLDDGDTLRIYYGAADTSVCVATASLGALLALARDPLRLSADEPSSARLHEPLHRAEQLCGLLVGRRCVARRDRVADAVGDVILEQLRAPTCSSAVLTAAIWVRMSMQ